MWKTLIIVIKFLCWENGAINSLLGLTPPKECEVEKLRREMKNMIQSEWDDLIRKMCKPESTWKRAKMLTYADFLPIPKAWASFVIQTLESTSCNSEIPIKRVFTVAAILDEKPIDVGTLIANNIHEIATEKSSVVGHGSIINWLCEKQRVEEYDGDMYTSTVQPITDIIMDGFVKKYEAFIMEREREREVQHRKHHHTSRQLKWSMAKGAIMATNWMNETSDQMWVNRSKFSTEFSAEAQMHRRPIIGSYERFDSSRDHMDVYFAHQKQFAAFMKKEITDDFNAGEGRANDSFFEGLPVLPDDGGDEDIHMG
ncbi:hypothetical protein MTR_0126s0010 [Medicago truncatula]|uniref:Putative plant transposon protein domain-containing protein n=1 Tax=Medicago truncatula TaxID=3880 RepID=A0A072TI92_MEDTR|nr:hypothetical protein MTR_0126s0010 [Medicago truncatula]